MRCIKSICKLKNSLFSTCMSVIFPLMRYVRCSRKLQVFSKVRQTGNVAAFGTYMRVCPVDE